jgi:hypothetical protein
MNIISFFLHWLLLLCLSLKNYYKNGDYLPTSFTVIVRIKKAVGNSACHTVGSQ